MEAGNHAPRVAASALTWSAPALGARLVVSGTRTTRPDSTASHAILHRVAGKRLLVLGGGFGGLDVMRAIGRSRVAREYWDTLVVDKENFFQFNPLLPAVAVGAVETRHIVYPLRDAARHRHVRFIKNKVTHIDLARREVMLHNDKKEHWDTLVIALGSVTQYYGIPGAAEHTRPFKTLVDAMTLRARVVELFEMAEQADSDAQRGRLLSFAIVGGGVTGVEVAAELMDMALGTLLPKFPSLRPSHLRITIIERGDRLVPTASPDHSAYVTRHLARRGVRMRLGAGVSEVRPREIVLAGGDVEHAFTIVWTAGVRAADPVLDLPTRHLGDGRVPVDDRLRAQGADGTPLEEVYVIGDCAAGAPAGGSPLPTLAQTAVAMGGYLGDALVRRAEGRPVAPFRFEPKGYIISLGKNTSVVDFAGFKMSGRLAWLLWAATYLVKMVGFRKQLEVGLDHLLHMFFEHDTSQILARRQVLSDEELNLSLADPSPGAAGVRR
jgi:NADH:quinone reductase (non-electrogenic)